MFEQQKIGTIFCMVIDVLMPNFFDISRCLCPPGYSGLGCEDYDEEGCGSTKCFDGQCLIDRVTDDDVIYSCKCDRGFIGTECQTCK